MQVFIMKIEIWILRSEKHKIKLEKIWQSIKNLIYTFQITFG